MAPWSMTGHDSEAARHCTIATMASAAAPSVSPWRRASEYQPSSARPWYQGPGRSPWARRSLGRSPAPGQRGQVGRPGVAAGGTEPPALPVHPGRHERPAADGAGVLDGLGLRLGPKGRPPPALGRPVPAPTGAVDLVPAARGRPEGLEAGPADVPARPGDRAPECGVGLIPGRGQDPGIEGKPSRRTGHEAGP